MALTLAEWLSLRTREQLAALLTARPEASAEPVPRDLAELADRLAIPGSVAAAVHWLPAPAVQVIEVLQLLGPGGGHRTAVAGWLGCESGDHGLTDTLALLANQALAWPDGDAGPEGPHDETWRMVDPLYRAFRFPLGLGAPAATLLPRYSVEQLRPIARTLGLPSHGRRPELLNAIEAVLCDPERVRELVSHAGSQISARLRALADSGPDTEHISGWYGYYEPEQALRWGTGRGLVITDSWGVPQLPREVAMALRGPGWHAPFTPRRPEPELTEVSPATVEREAAAAGNTAVEQLAALLAAIDAAPVTLLKSGGVGVKELRRLARTTGLEEPVVRLWLEVAHEADLVGVVPARSGGGELLPAPGYDDWAAAEPADRLAAVLPVWAVLTTSPLLGPASGESKPPPALLRDHSGQLAAAVRQLLLAVVRGLPAGTAVAGQAGLAEAVRWLSPLLVDADPDADRLVAAAWREAHLVGVVAHGAFTPLGEALTSGSRAELAAACRTLLPAAAGEVVFQADLTALVPGAPERALADLLDTAADRESGGGAVTWRFSAGTVRRALDIGWQSDELVAALRERAVGGSLPQPLAYLVADVARRHGAIRVREARCVLHTEDPALAAELTGARSLRSLALSQVAPTVLAAAAPVDDVLAALRAAGYAPVAESADGVPQLTRVQPRRAGGRPGGHAHRRRRDAEPPAPEPPDPLTLADQLLVAPVPAPGSRPHRPTWPDQPTLGMAGEAFPDDYQAEYEQVKYGAEEADPEPAIDEPLDVSGELAERAGHLGAGERRLLAHAIETSQPVRIHYTNAQGNSTVRVIDSAELIGEHLVAWCQLRDDERMFALHRIGSVAPAS